MKSNYCQNNSHQWSRGYTSQTCTSTASYFETSRALAGTRWLTGKDHRKEMRKLNKLNPNEKPKKNDHPNFSCVITAKGKNEAKKETLNVLEQLKTIIDNNHKTKQ